MKVTDRKEWLDIVRRRFDHPAIVLWRAVELRHLAKAIEQNDFKEPILDLGCAEGNIAEALFKDKLLIGLDNCWELLSKNSKRQTYRALTLADACQMPYKDGACGSVFSNCVVEHILDIGRLLDEVNRVLCSGGLFLLTVPSDKFTDFLFFGAVLRKIGLIRISEWYKAKRNKMLNHFHCYNHKFWEGILAGKGFDLVGHCYYMSKEATFVWDFLAALVLAVKFTWPLRCLSPHLNKLLASKLRKYYNMDSEAGSGLLLVARKVVS